MRRQRVITKGHAMAEILTVRSMPSCTLSGPFPLSSSIIQAFHLIFNYNRVPWLRSGRKLTRILLLTTNKSHVLGHEEGHYLCHTDF